MHLGRPGCQMKIVDMSDVYRKALRRLSGHVSPFSRQSTGSSVSFCSRSRLLRLGRVRWWSEFKVLARSQNPSSDSALSRAGPARPTASSETGSALQRSSSELYLPATADNYIKWPGQVIRLLVGDALGRSTSHDAAGGAAHSAADAVPAARRWWAWWREGCEEGLA